MNKVSKMEAVKLPKRNRAIEFRNSTWNEEKRTVEVVCSVGSRGQRFSWSRGDFLEELVISAESVVLDRFNNNAPVLDSHQGYELSNIIGVVEPGSARVEGGQLLATVRLSDREELQGIVRDIASGIIRNVSIGYRIIEAIEVMEENTDLPIMRVTKFEPMELSFVPMGFDDMAQTRQNEVNNLFDCDFQRIERDSEMNEEEKTVQVEQAVQPSVDTDAIKREAIEAERARVVGIQNCVRKAKLESSVAEKMISEGRSITEAHEIVLDELAKRDEQMKTESQQTSIEVGEDQDKANRVAGASLALRIKGLGESKTRKLDDNARRFMSMRIVDVARHFVGANSFESDRELLKRAHSTSDFPLVLEDSINKSLRQEYAEAPQTWSPITRVVTASDFKQISRVQLGDASALEAVGEGAEYKYGTVSEQAEKYQVEKFGKMLSITWESMINDDLDAFTRLPAKLGRRARDLESDRLWAILTANAALADGINLFAAGHSNLQSALALSIDSLAAMRAAMRQQRGLAPKTGEQGSLLNLNPEYLIVPAALETAGEKVISTNMLADAQGNINPFAGRLQLIVEPRLDDDSPTAHYMAAGVGAIDILELARLADEQGPVIETQEGFDVDGMKVKIRHVFGVKAIDYRGLQKNPGA